MTISREAFLSKTAKRYVDKVILGDHYRFQSLTEGEKASYEIKLQDKKAGMSYEKSRALLLCRTLVDEEGNRILQDTDVPAVMAMDGRVTTAAFVVAQEHCGYEDGDISELVKNSD
jgi:hypothetical protein